MKPMEQVDTYLVTMPEQAVVLLHPLRATMLNHLLTPASATEVAKAMNETPQKMNYHLKTLEKSGLVKRVGTRQVRNLVEVMYQAIAKSFMLAETLGMRDETVQKLKDQGSLAFVVATADQMKREAMQLLEQADSEHVPSATLSGEVTLATEEERARFVEEYVQLLQGLMKKYDVQTPDKNKQDFNHSKPAENQQAYQVRIAIYPKPEMGGE
ncbi:winged helix-turn-helix domain-containing protein [Brevibacillus daliensis]|uniref:winged helix-turn-helix domain-containing protein n=1 Tax=Brevibacillus daliensis TaxID=2892995 RepID=UPI001E2F8BB7|nr:helix-turn-helix domain-containing protein [Brevibacillus daliensis]